MVAAPKFECVIVVYSNHVLNLRVISILLLLVQFLGANVLPFSEFRNKKIRSVPTRKYRMDTRTIGSFVGQGMENSMDQNGLYARQLIQETSTASYYYCIN